MNCRPNTDQRSLLQGAKDAVDPAGILNPGKLGIPSRFGEIGLP